MEITRQLKNQHLLWRAGFGVAASDISDLERMQPHKWYKRIEKASAEAPAAIDEVSAFVRETMTQEPEDDGLTDPETRKKERAEERRQVNRQSNLDIRKMTLSWMNEMVNSPAQLREKMALFWHGHFACRVNNSLYQQMLLHTIRENALGHFGDLLLAVSKSASMLSFLNNQQNRKKKPNENFAREVMELFTMGRGPYSEKDIKEAARAFTGWGFERNGSFIFRQKAHDEGSKTVLGASGNLTGEDVLNIILKRQETALYLCRKIYRYFVNEQPDEVQVRWLADRFHKSNYHIGELMHDIFTSDWFYEERHIGTRIKSPVEYIVGIRRMLPMHIRNEEVQILLQRLLGQWLFNPPNVAGWPGGNAWIDSSSLMLRLRIPGLIQTDETVNIKPKGNDDVEMGRKEMLPVGGPKPKKPGSGYQVIASIDWKTFEKELNKTKDKEVYALLENLLLQTQRGAITLQSLQSLLRNNTPGEYLQSLTVALMSTPEYQLC